MSNKQKTYFTPFRKMFVIMLIEFIFLSILISPIIALFITLRIGSLEDIYDFVASLVIYFLIALTVFLIFSPIFAALVASPVSYKPRLIIDPVGIKVYDSVIFIRQTRWKSIVEAKYRNRLGVKVIFIISSETRRKIPVPLFLSDMESFQRNVLEVVCHLQHGHL